MNTELVPENPSISDYCTGCGRGIPGFVDIDQQALVVSIGSSNRDEECDELWILCGHCGDELNRFVNEVLSPSSNPYQPEDIACDACGFCDGSLTLENAQKLSASPSEGLRGQGWYTLVCESCAQVLINYVESLPEEDPSGLDDVYYPEPLRTTDIRETIETANHEYIYNYLKEAEPGDTFEFDTFVKGLDDHEPHEYLTATVEVTENDQHPFGNKLDATVVKEPTGYSRVPFPESYSFDYAVSGIDEVYYRTTATAVGVSQPNSRNSGVGTVVALTPQN